MVVSPLAAAGASPRMRGTAMISATRWLVLGASPRMRGTSWPAAGRRVMCGASPRMRGTAPDDQDYAATFGASPRMRGTARAAGLRRGHGRCIPAHAGNGAHHRSTSSAAAVHPRACGERAKHGGVTAAITAVHPRACGERLQVTIGGARKAGASPRMRGTDAVALFAAELRRCIPAHAGNGQPDQPAASVQPVHPRACGERRLINAGESRGDGASPRMRGTALGDGGEVGGVRCIPAHAGNGRSQQA